MKLIVRSILLLVSILWVQQGFGQYRIGPKVVAMANYHFMHSKENLREDLHGDPHRFITNRINYGYGVGLSMTYKVRPLFTVNIDAMYVNRGATLKGGINNEFSHVERFNLVDVPIGFRYRMGKTDTYEWYISGGGDLSYMVNGRGIVRSFEYDEAATPPYEYKLKRGKELLVDDDVLLIPNGHGVMVGLEVGAGIIFPMLGNQWMTIEVMYKHGHSWLGEDEGIDVGLEEYFIDYRKTPSSLAISVSYQLERKIGEFRKGKTTYGKNKR